MHVWCNNVACNTTTDLTLYKVTGEDCLNVIDKRDVDDVQ